MTSPPVSPALQTLRETLLQLADPERVAMSQRFFKTGPGEYGAGDRFVGITMPQIRATVKQHARLVTSDDCRQLVRSPIHELRMAGLLIWVAHYTRATPEVKKYIFDLYMQHIEWINSWDLVDATSEHIVGDYICTHMQHQQRAAFIDRCIASPHLWTRRIIILASFHEIKKGNEKLTLYIARHFLGPQHDLIQKAVGWMLREVGQRASEKALLTFLDEYTPQMSRTMLRYAIERLTPAQKSHYLAL